MLSKFLVKYKRQVCFYIFGRVFLFSQKLIPSPRVPRKKNTFGSFKIIWIFSQEYLHSHCVPVKFHKVIMSFVYLCSSQIKIFINKSLQVMYIYMCMWDTFFFQIFPELQNFTVSLKKNWGTSQTPVRCCPNYILPLSYI